MNKQWKELLLLFVVVVITRIPFIFNGLGVEEDSYTLVTTCQRMVETGTYEMSRAPGHPLQEFVINIFPYASAWVLNGLSTLFSFITALFFYLILAHYNCKEKLLSTAALLCIPVIIIASVSTIDYVWALALMVGAFYYLLKEKHWIIGVYIGLAVACRVTAILICLPIFVYLLQNKGWKNSIKPLFTIGIFILIVAAALYYPAFHTYGLAFFYTYDLPYPNLPKVLYKGTFGVWGIWGIVALLITFIHLFKRWNKKEKTTIQHKDLFFFSIIMIVVTIISYGFLPEKSAFWIPAIPFILFVLHLIIENEKMLRIILVLFIISPFVSNIQLVDPLRGSQASPLSVKKTIENQEIGFDLLYGPIISDYTKRKKKQEFTETFISQYSNEEQATLYLCGFWYAQIEYELKNRLLFRENQEIKAGCTIEEARMRVKNGEQVIVLPEQEKFNITKHGMAIEEERGIFHYLRH